MQQGRDWIKSSAKKAKKMNKTGMLLKNVHNKGKFARDCVDICIVTSLNWWPESQRYKLLIPGCWVPLYTQHLKGSVHIPQLYNVSAAPFTTNACHINNSFYPLVDKYLSSKISWERCLCGPCKYEKQSFFIKQHQSTNHT